MSVDETMSHSSITAYKEECYTETIFHLGLLNKTLLEGRGNCENDLMNFYSSFYQLWLITRGPVAAKQRMIKLEDSGLDEKLRGWFNQEIDAQNRKASTQIMAEKGVDYAEKWIKLLSDAGVI